MTITKEEINDICEYWTYAPDEAIESVIKSAKGDIEMYQNRINDKLCFIKLLESIMDVRTP